MVSESAAAKQLRREQLRDFLRTRRARRTPQELGLISTGTRRTPGLRREEVAQLAGVGVSWYTWLEQGRDINVSDDVLEAVSRALQLSEPERAHLFVLAGLRPPRPHGLPTATVAPELRRLLDSWSPHPAILRDRYWNLLAINDGTRAAFGYDDGDHNCLISFFTNAQYRDLHTEWSAIAPEVVAAYRADAAHAPGDPAFERVISELTTVSPEFAELWARHDVAAPTQAVKAVHHREAGDLIFDKTTMAVIDQPDWYLEFYNPQPGTGTAERLAHLMRGSQLASA
ncbi:helix-turn-helix domain-containing protein [Nocardia huaxiensis]|uniref:Helix-turn-helix domain-containing protein n=1 Tax=Nocardia huaxiensis TaxID=2755382 RepID=A0A7D6ZRU7_9NOCA|nr:helix-turn-helix domain-containing protein [Nocardia huaxiensis]